MPHAFRNQPLRGLYLSYQVLTTLLLRLPWWTLISLLRSWRPKPSWDLRRAVMVNLTRHLIKVSAQTGPLIIRTPDYRAIEPDVEEYGVWVEGVPELMSSELQAFAKTSSTKAIRIPGYWMHKNSSDIKVGSPPIQGEKILYRLHGGAYTRCSAHPRDPTAMMSREVLELAEVLQRAFAIEYRLSSTAPFSEAGPFPSALLDALAGYNYLVNVVGFTPSDIIIIGDSAGGNLAHALTRYLVENQHSTEAQVPGPPGALVLVSPWCDMSNSHFGPESSIYRCRDTDILVIEKGHSYPASAFLGPHGFEAAETNRYISPSCKSLSISFKGFPRTFITAGGGELLLDEVRTLKARMTADLGEGDVRYIEEPDGVHAYPLFKWHEPEKTRTLKEIAKWIGTAT